MRKQKRQDALEAAAACATTERVSESGSDAGDYRDDFHDAIDDTMAPVQPSGSGQGELNGGNTARVVVEYDGEDKPDAGGVSGKLNSIAQLACDADNIDKWLRRLE